MGGVSTGGEKMSNGTAFVNLIMTAIGLGLLRLPILMATFGFFIGSLMLTVSFLATVYLSKLLFDSLLDFDRKTNRMEAKITSFSEMGRVYFGSLGEAAIGFMLQGCLVGVLGIMLRLLASQMFYLIPSVSFFGWFLVFSVFLIPLGWIPTFNDIGFISKLGVVSLFAVILLYITCSMNAFFNPPSDPIVYNSNKFNALTLFSVFNQELMSYCISTGVPSIVKEMKYPKSFMKICFLSMLGTWALYMVISVSGYMGYGDALLDKNAGTAISRMSPGENVYSQPESSSFLSMALRISVVVLIASHYLALFAPVASQTDEILGVEPQRVDALTTKQKADLELEECRTATDEGTESKVLSSEGLFRTSSKRHALDFSSSPQGVRSFVRKVGRTFSILLTGLIGMTLGEGAIFGLVSAIFSVSLVITVPVLCYWKQQAKFNKLSGPKNLLLGSLTLLGVACTVLGVWETIQSM